MIKLIKSLFLKRKQSNKVVKELLEKTPLIINLQVLNEMAFIDLLEELGYRRGMWKIEENDKLEKLMSAANKLAKKQMNEINK